MRKFLIGLVGVGLIAQVSPSAASSVGGTCSPALNQLGGQWDALGFSPPEKPGAWRVLGSGGLAISGIEYQQLVRGIRAAAVACAAGHDTDATRQIRSLQTELSGFNKGRSSD
jgi:hypothetical protein